MRSSTIGTGRLTAIAAAGLAVAIALGGPPQARSQTTAQTPRALASNGAVVEMPEIAGLDCPGIEAALRRIDLSDYRSGAQLPLGHPDWPIYEYEHRLARRYYADCLLARQVFGDPGSAFSPGFGAE